jgi:hypothetical protein
MSTDPPQPHYFLPQWVQASSATLTCDLCVYGGTAAGVVAAIAAARLGRSVVLLHPGLHLGGMTTGGLGWTDYGRKQVIGGLARQFYRDLGRHYGHDEQWHFAPAPAAAVLQSWLSDANVPVRRAQFLDRVHKHGNRIAAVAMLGGLTVRAAVFIDATYEGDLLAKAGVDYAVGREDNRVYGETLNGAQVRATHQFSHPVDPYLVPGTPSSGLLPQIEPVDQSAHQGRGDRRVQAYNFRVCMTDDPALRIPWRQPPGFDPRLYILATRWFAGPKDAYNEQLSAGAAVPNKFDVFPDLTPGGFHKTDTNNHGPASSDFIGGNWDWPEATYERREEIFQAHVAYQQGLYWHLANDPAIPARYRAAYAAWGLPRDEFADTGNWPHQLYVREARRMIGDYVLTEHDCTGARRPADAVGMASYTMDSHNCTRFVRVVGGQPQVGNDGDVQVPPTDPYPIALQAVTPRAGSCANLIVPVCLSASHIAYGSARMEPVFMVLGESAAHIADLAQAQKGAVQAVDAAALRARLLAAGQVLELPAP